MRKPKQKTLPKVDPLAPRLSLLVKFYSICVHANEILSPTGRPADKVALESVLYDPEVTDFVTGMAVIAPVQRQTERKYEVRSIDSSVLEQRER